jgi:hypothetical protein
MTSVFVLQHVHELADGGENVKFIGVYSSRQKAHEAVTRLSRVPGFSEAADGFHIDEYRLDEDQWVEGYANLADA